MWTTQRNYRYQINLGRGKGGGLFLGSGRHKKDIKRESMHLAAGEMLITPSKTEGGITEDTPWYLRSSLLLTEPTAQLLERMLWLLSLLINFIGNRERSSTAPRVRKRPLVSPTTHCKKEQHCPCGSQCRCLFGGTLFWALQQQIWAPTCWPVGKVV